MSEETPDPRPEVTYAQFDTFLREKGADRPCPDCGHPDWVIPTTGPEELLTETWLMNPIVRTGVPVLACYCQNCGHVKFYVSDVVHEFIDGKAKQ